MKSPRIRHALSHDNDAEEIHLIGHCNCVGLKLCRIEWMILLSFYVPAAISGWKQKNARRLRSALWIFATRARGAAWKPSAPLQTIRR